jgi:hypothetical protein
MSGFVEHPAVIIWIKNGKIVENAGVDPDMYDQKRDKK